MRTSTIGFLSAMGMGLMLLAVPVLHAQGTAQEGQQAAPRQVISDSELQAFVQANGKIAEIRTSYESQLRAVQNPEQAKQLQQQAQQEMVTAVTEAGLTVDRYNTIIAAVQGNENVRERYNAIQQEGS